MNTPSNIKINSVNASQHTAYTLTPEFEAVAKAFQVIANNKDLVHKAIKLKAKDDLSDLKKASKVTAESSSFLSEFPDYLVDALAASYAFLVDNKKVYVQYKIDDKGREYAVGAFSHFEPCVLLPLLCDIDECVSKLKKANVLAKSAKAVPPKLMKAAQAIKAGDPSAAKFFIEKQVCQLANSENAIVKFTFKPSAMVAALVASELEAAS